MQLGIQFDVVEWDGFHIKGAGIDAYLNRLLNAMVAFDCSHSI